MTEIDKIVTKESPVVETDYADKRLWNKWFEYYGSTPKAYRIITGKSTSIKYRATLLANFLNGTITADNQPITIRISQIERNTRLSFDQICKILNNRNLIAQFSVLKRAQIVGNDIIISLAKSTGKVSYAGFSNFVKGFSNIMQDSTHSDDYDKFEDDVENIFKAIQFKVERLGVKKSGTPLPDCIIRSDVGSDPAKYWACLIDAKSRVHSFNLDAGSRRAMKEYAEGYSKTVSGNNPYPLKALLYVSSLFSGDVEGKIADLEKKSNVKCACITAENLLYLLDVYLNNPRAVTHEKILRLLRSGMEVTKQMIDTAKNNL